MSVIVASLDSSRSIARCLDALTESCRDLNPEVIVVQAGHEPVLDRALAAYPEIRLVSLPADTLTPQLWSAGLALSTGTVAALTTGHCFVARNWASDLLRAIEGGAAAAGGPLRLHPDATAVDAAIFFLRYSAFIEGREDGPVADLAGDNSAYRRDMIPPSSWAIDTGFWELEVNRAIRSSGGSLAWVDSAVADFGMSFRLDSICRHRFAHGRLFGKARVRDGAASRLRIVLGSPLVPFVLAFRAATRVARIPSYRMRFVTALPSLLLIAGFWAAGEAVGALEA